MIQLREIKDGVGGVTLDGKMFTAVKGSKMGFRVVYAIYLLLEIAGKVLNSK